MGGLAGWCLGSPAVTGCIQEMLMRCWCVSCCDNVHVWNVCSCSMFCLGGCFILVTLLFQVITCYNQSGSVKKKQTLIHSNQILPSMMLLRCFTWIVPIHPELGVGNFQSYVSGSCQFTPRFCLLKRHVLPKRLLERRLFDHRSDFWLKMSMSPDFGADWNT